jgi:hypothetical protein
MTSRYDIAEYKLIGNANHTSFMGQKECNLSDDFTMGIGLLPTHWSPYPRAFIHLPFIYQMVSKGLNSYGKTGNFNPKISHFNKWQVTH